MLYGICMALIFNRRGGEGEGGGRMRRKGEMGWVKVESCLCKWESFKDGYTKPIFEHE